MICITQYRAAIGCWHSCINRTCSTCCYQSSPLWSNYIFVLQLLAGPVLGSHPCLYICIIVLIISGDIHPNPGPSHSCEDANIRFCHFNARSILKPGRLDEVYQELCCLHCFDIIGVSESHLSDAVCDDDIMLENYNCFRRDRNRHGGGVLLYVHNSFSCHRRTDLECDDLELLWCEVQLTNHKLLAGVCYRPPNQNAQSIENFIECLNDSLLSITASSNQTTVLMGDFNDRCSLWHSDHSNSELGLKLVNLLSSFNMSQLIESPTRNDYLLDLLITDSPECVFDTGVLDPIDQLDHSIIFGSLASARPKLAKVTRKIWLYNHGNFDRLNNLLFLTDWESLFSAYPDVDELTVNFTHLLLQYVDLCVPNKTVTIRPRDKPGMTGEIRRLFRVAKRLHRKSKRTNNPVHAEQFRNARREAKSAFRRSRSQFYKDLADKLTDPTTSSKTFWKLNKLVLGQKATPGIPDINHNGTMVSDPATKASLLNVYFASQCSLPAGSDADPLPDLGEPATDSTLQHITILADEARKVLRSLDVSKASGPDGISNRVLRECADSLCIPLARLFNISLLSGSFPSSWKSANVVPIFKKNDRHLLSNYRPISLLPTMSKVFERIVHARLYAHCTENNLLTEKNSGFKRSDSTVNQLVFIDHKIRKALENKHDACLVFLDVSKAFDKVWHRGLIHKLRHFGLSNSLLQWFSSYLSGRQQQVLLDGITSAPAGVSAGVPQGSILGPLLYLIYTNDLADKLSCDPHFFADDTFLLDIFVNPALSSARINRDLDIIHNWGKSCKITFNPSKTKYMIVTKRNQNIDYPDPVFNNTPIVKTLSHKHLGLHLSSDLTWSTHINQTIVRASRKLHLINNVKHLLPRRSLCSLYTTMVLPVIEYCDVVYDNCTIADSLAIERVQRRAALMCTGAYRHTSTDSLLADLGWQPLRIRREIHKLGLLYKILTSLVPPYLNQLIPSQPRNVYSLRSRSDNSIPIPPSRLSSTRSAFVHSTIKLWNKLPLDIRIANSVGIFKNRVSSHLSCRYNSKFIPSLYSYSPVGKAPVHHCRLRLGLSALNFHRFTYNLIQHKSCPNCTANCENTNHFLFHCPTYAALRVTLMEDLRTLLPPNIVHNLTHLENVLLFGSGELPLTTMLSVFNCLYTYISASGRFQ